MLLLTQCIKGPRILYYTVYTYVYGIYIPHAYIQHTVHVWLIQHSTYVSVEYDVRFIACRTMGDLHSNFVIAVQCTVGARALKLLCCLRCPLHNPPVIL